MPASDLDAPADWLSQWLSLSRYFRQRLAERYAQTGLTEARAAVLEVLSGSATAHTQAELAGELSLSESHLCALIEQMRNEGLLCRQRSQLDRRKTLISITDEGRVRCQRIQTIHTNFEAELQARFAPATRNQLSGVLEKLFQELQQEITPPSRRRAA